MLALDSNLVSAISRSVLEYWTFRTVYKCCVIALRIFQTVSKFVVVTRRVSAAFLGNNARTGRCGGLGSAPTALFQSRICQHLAGQIQQLALGARSANSAALRPIDPSTPASEDPIPVRSFQPRYAKVHVPVPIWKVPWAWGFLSPSLGGARSIVTVLGIIGGHYAIPRMFPKRGVPSGQDL